MATAIVAGSVVSLVSCSVYGAPFPSPAFCGDHHRDPDEECDDGNRDDRDECRNDCTLPVCGDGVVSTGEECEPSLTPLCNDACALDGSLAASSSGAGGGGGTPAAGGAGGS